MCASHPCHMILLFSHDLLRQTCLETAGISQAELLPLYRHTSRGFSECQLQHMVTTATIFQGDYDYGCSGDKQPQDYAVPVAHKDKGGKKRAESNTRGLNGFSGSAVSCQSPVSGRSQCWGQGGCGWDLWWNDDIAKDCSEGGASGPRTASQALDYTDAHPFASASHPHKTHRQLTAQPKKKKDQERAEWTKRFGSVSKPSQCSHCIPLHNLTTSSTPKCI